MTWTSGAIKALTRETPTRQLMRQAIQTTGRLWMGLNSRSGNDVSPDDIRAVNAALDEGGLYSMVLAWAEAHHVNDTLAVCMLESGALERVDTTSGPTLMLVVDLTLEEAKAATRVWVGLQPRLNADVREACR